MACALRFGDESSGGPCATGERASCDGRGPGRLHRVADHLLHLWLRRDSLGRQRRALAWLDDRLLDDVALTRAEVDRERWKPAWLP